MLARRGRGRGGVGVVGLVVGAVVGGVGRGGGVGRRALAALASRGALLRARLLLLLFLLGAQLVSPAEVARISTAAVELRDKIDRDRVRPALERWGS